MLYRHNSKRKIPYFFMNSYTKRQALLQHAHFTDNIVKYRHPPSTISGIAYIRSIAITSPIADRLSLLTLLKQLRQYENIYSYWIPMLHIISPNSASIALACLLVASARILSLTWQSSSYTLIA